ncbi:hypothetical protein ACHQM5_026243 [Ranunculus cassubicifolius]
MEAISKAPFAELTSLEESKPYGSSLYDVEVDSWRNRSASGGKESYKPKPGDILILSDAAPEDISDLNRYGKTWIYASVSRVVDNDDLPNGASSRDFYDNNTCMNLKIKTSQPVEMKEGMRNSLFAVFLINLTTNNRIWIALHKLGNTRMLTEVLCPDSLLLYIAALQSKTDSTVRLIWGPPGTGKTKTVSTLPYNLLKMKCRTLSCAPTNVAITELAARVLKLVRETYRPT